jgi:hypothetical protein
MMKCKHCGVELEENMNYCPLCGHATGNEITDFPDVPVIESPAPVRQPLSAFQKLTGGQKRRLVWEIIGIILLSGMIIPMLIDFIGNGAITWSKYPAVTGLTLFINVTLVAFWQRRPILLLTVSFIASSALLIFLNRFSANPGWGINLGIPLLLAAYLIIFGLTLLVRRMRQYGLNLIAFLLLAAGLLCICIEGIISLYNDQALHLQWSLIVMVSILPVSAFLLLVHFKLKKGTDLKRFFHI